MVLTTGRLKKEVSSWPGISVHPHRFAAWEYRFGKAEVGHVHFWGDADIPFQRPVHDYLLDRGLAEKHRWVPDSGWTTFRIRGDKDIEHAIWLMRLSYIRFALKFEADPLRFLDAEADRLQLGPDLAAILSRFIPAGVAPKKDLSIPA
jgi:hypothetical protein